MTKTKSDLTLLDEIGDFEHIDDPETDAILEDAEKDLLSSSLDDLSEDLDGPFEELEESNSDEFFNDSSSTEEDFLAGPEDVDPFEMTDGQEEYEEDLESSFDEFETLNEEESYQNDSLLPENPEVTGEVDLPTQDSTSEFSLEDSKESQINEAPEIDWDPSPVEPAQTLPPLVPEKANLKEVKEFSEDLTLGPANIGGSPPYSLLIENVDSLDQIDLILDILKEYEAINKNDEEIFRKGLENGAILLAQLSEYAAIFLAHKLRRINISLKVAPSDVLHPPKVSDPTHKGSIRSNHLSQNQELSAFSKGKGLNVQDIIISTTPVLEDHVIKKYLGIISAHLTVNEETLKRDYQSKSNKQLPHGHFDGPPRESDEIISDNLQLGLNEVYYQLTQTLREQALHKKANAVVGVTYQVTPLPGEQKLYTVSSTGSAVTVIGR